MTARWLLYGAYGFTGRLIARRAVASGEAPVLAGRDEARLAPLARELGLEHRAFELEAESRVAAALEGVDAVLHAAGPFVDTWEPMVEACLARRCHYLDITGEIEVLESVHALDARARETGVALIPGVGFDVVPTDCAAVSVARSLDEPTHLDIAFMATGRPSGGSLRGILEALARPGVVRRDGRLTDVPHGSIGRQVPFCDGTHALVAIPWGDVSSAWHSTAVPNIRVFTRVPGSQAWLLRIARHIVAVGSVRRALKAIVGRSGGPSDDELADGRSCVWAEAWNEAGDRASAELVATNGYTFTADSAVLAVRRLRGKPPAELVGAHTPATAFGVDFVDSVPGVRWIRGPGRGERERAGAP